MAEDSPLNSYRNVFLMFCIVPNHFTFKDLKNKFHIYMRIN